MAKTLTISSNIPDIKKAILALKRDLPYLIGNEAKNHFLEGFSKGGGQTDASISGWVKRKKNTDKNKKKSRALLVSSSHLRGDIDTRKTTFQEIVIGTQDTDYGIYHNEGRYPQPKREFLGDSMILMNKINSITQMKFKKVLE